jgi:WD40 repeat protein
VTTLYRSLESNSNSPKSPGRRVAVASVLTWCAVGLIGAATSVLTPFAARANAPLADALPVVISAGADHDIKKWDGTGKLAATLGSHDDAVNALLLVGPDTLISVGAEGACKIWSVTEARMTLSIDAVKGSALSVALTPDMRTLAIGTASGKIALFSRATGKRLAEADAHNDGVRALRFTSDGATLFSASADRQIRFWKVMTGAKTGLDYQSNISAHDEAVNSLVLSPDDNTIATISADGYLKTWQRSGGALVNRVKVCDHGAAALAYSPDGRTIATGDEDGRVRLWTAANFAPISTLGSHDRAVTCLAWSADGKFVVSGGADKTLRYWSLDQMKQAARITAHDGVVKAVVILP